MGPFFMRLRGASMATLPVLLRNPRILLLGGGKVAWQKARVLYDNGIDFTLLAESWCDELAQLAVPKLSGTVRQTDLHEYNIVVDATGNPAVGELLAAEKKSRFLLVNRVDAPQQCDFYFSALLNYGALKIAISTDGHSPVLGQVVRDKIKALIPENIAQLVAEKAQQRARGEIDRDQTRHQALRGFAEVALVSCGPGDVNSLTLEAFHCLQNSDIAFHAVDIPDQILEIIPAAVLKVAFTDFGPTTTGQLEDDNIRRLLHAAQQGLRIACLYPGDCRKVAAAQYLANYLSRQAIRLRWIPGFDSVKKTTQQRDH